MAKQISTSIGGVVKKVSKVYCGVGGVVKKVKKGVCGVGGVVKTFFSGHYYTYGDVCSDVTGGYTFISGNAAGGPNCTGWSGVPTAALNSDHIYIHIPNQTYGSDDEPGAGCNMQGLYHSNNKVDLTEYSKLYFKYDVTFGRHLDSDDEDTYYKVIFNVGSGNYMESSSGTFEHKVIDGDATGATASINVSGLSGSYYIKMFATRVREKVSRIRDDSLTLKVYEIWVE